MALAPPGPSDIVIAGATGDLTQRKLLPALYNLSLDGLLPPGSRVMGFARSALTDEQFRERTAESIRRYSRRPLEGAAWEAFAGRLSYVSARDGGLLELARRLEGRPRLLYLAVPPRILPSLVGAMAGAGLARRARVVVEKPFGHDLASAASLDYVLRDVFDESQIFRIDHYLGKETVQNILVLRFGNALWERVWHRDAIEHVQITVAESEGIEGRAGFYEETGALRDVIQNHALQVLSLLTMEAPASFEVETIRDEKTKLLRTLKPLTPANVVRGQYTAGEVGGEQVPGYRQEEGVAPDSQTETYIALRTEIDNWRWAGVPFYLRHGKRLPRRVTEVHIAFREAPVRLFTDLGVSAEDVRPNHLTIRIQPDEGITFSFLAKAPGPEVRVRPVRMNFSYDESFTTQPAEAYERLLHDAMEGDHMLFLRGDGVERSWEIVAPVLESPPPLYFYPAGTWGPPEANLVGIQDWHLH